MIFYIFGQSYKFFDFLDDENDTYSKIKSVLHLKAR
jgi:hypothetical protein